MSGRLRWSSDADRGIRRIARGQAFAYLQPDGKPLRDDAVLARIRKLAIPPAYHDVWICADPDGHLQATGRDARGRKQYRYHADWHAVRGQTKFEHMLEFGRALPRIRTRVQKLLAGNDQPTREHVLATLVRLLDTTWMRIGNDEYARSNKSYGLSTLRNRHADVRGSELRLSFVGKSGVRHDVMLSDRRVARIVRRCRDLPGQELFQYVDADAGVHKLDSADVNAWLTEVAGLHVTAKDFRTWHGSVQGLQLTLDGCASGGRHGSPPTTAQTVLAAVAKRLGNTPAVCKKAYVHPTVLSLGEALGAVETSAEVLTRKWATTAPVLHGLSAGERRLMGLLRVPERKPRKAAAAGANAKARAMPGGTSKGAGAAVKAMVEAAAVFALEPVKLAPAGRPPTRKRADPKTAAASGAVTAARR